VTKAASGDELFGSFAEAAFVTALRLFTGLDIQGHKERRENFFNILAPLRGKKSVSDSAVASSSEFGVGRGPWPRP
jgi:hypothetical protein